MHSDKTGKTIAPESWKDGSQGKGDQTGVTGSPNGNGLGLSAEDIGNLENSHYNTLFDGLPKKRKTNEMITVRKTVTTIVEEPNPAEKVDETKHAVHQTDVNVIEARSQNLSKDTNERASAEQVDTIRRESLEQQESALRVSYERRLLENEERVAALESQLRECRQNGEQEELRGRIEGELREQIELEYSAEIRRLTRLVKTQEDQSVKRIGGVDREVGSKASNEKSRSRDGVQEERYGRRVEELEGLLERERAEGRGVQDEVDILKSTVYSLTSLLKEEKEKGSGMREKLAVEIRENDGLLKELAEARAEIRRLSGLLNERARRGQAEAGRNKNSLNQANNRVVKSSKGPSNAPVQSDPVYHTNVYTRPEKTKNLYTVPSNYFAHDGPKPIPLVTDKTSSAAGKHTVVIKPEPEHFVEVKRELAGPRGTQHGDNGHQANEEDVSDHFERDSQEGYSHEEEGHHDADSYDDGYYGHEDGQYHSNDEGHSGDHSVDEDQSSNQFASNLNQGTNGRGSAHLSQNHSRPNHGLGNHQNRAQPRANPSQTSEQQREAPMSRSMIVHGAPTGHQVGHETTVRNSNNAQFSDTQQQRIESSSNPRNQGDRFGNSQASNGQKDPEGRQVDGNMTSSESQILRNQAVLQMVNSYLKVPTGYRNPYNSVVYQKQIFADRKDLLPTDKEFAYSSYGGGFGEYKHPLTDIKVPGIIAHKEASHYTSMLGLRESLQSAQKLNVQGKAREEYDYSQTAPKVVDQGLLSYH